jgi:hypothetical protein
MIPAPLRWAIGALGGDHGPAASLGAFRPPGTPAPQAEAVGPRALAHGARGQRGARSGLEDGHPRERPRRGRACSCRTGGRWRKACIRPDTACQPLCDAPRTLPFIRFQGRLELAHARGLLCLETTVVQCSLELAVCQAVARFKNGRVFTDIGDATPGFCGEALEASFYPYGCDKGLSSGLAPGTQHLCLRGGRAWGRGGSLTTKGKRSAPLKEGRRA